MGSGVRRHGKRDQYVMERRGGIAKKPASEKGENTCHRWHFVFSGERNMREEGAELKF